MTARDLSGKTALITGSSGGLGLAIATGLARAGCNIMLHGIEAIQSAEPVRAELERMHATKVLYQQADLADLAATTDLIAYCEKNLGEIDILVNNAVVRHFASTESFPVDRWDQAVAVNLSAAFHTIRLSLSGMRAKEWGRIFNMSSVYGSRGTINRIDYVTTKSGLIGMTRVVALENVDHGITCNAICPGSVHTPAIEARIQGLIEQNGLDRDEAIRQFLVGKQPTGRFISAEHVAELIVFLCSPAGNDITGAMLPMEGGWLAG